MQKMSTTQTLIYNARLVLPDKLIENGWVMMENGRIVDMGRDITRPEHIAQVIDASSGYISCSWSSVFSATTDR